STYQRLLEAGVRIWEYEVSMLHAKTMVVDGELAVVGSINLDPVSMQSADEGAIVIWDRAFTRQLAGDFERDLRHSREIMREGWSQRGLLDRFPDVWPAIIGPFLFGPSRGPAATPGRHAPRCRACATAARPTSPGRQPHACIQPPRPPAMHATARSGVRLH